MADPTLKIRIAGDLTAIKDTLTQLQSELKKVADVAAASGKRTAAGLGQAEAAAKREAQSAAQLVAALQQQAAAYGITGSKLLELNKQRDLARVKTDAERKSVAAAYDTMISKAKAAEAAQIKAASGMTRALSSVRNAVAGLVSVFAALQAVRLTVGLGDQFLQLNGVLKIATKTTEEFQIAQAGVLKIANATRAPVQETANTYGALERNTKSLGLSQAELLRTLETVNKAVGLTPVSAQAAQASLVQFGQALGGDFKAGAQELNSILEQTPGLAISIAQGLDVETSALKKMGEEGKLSTELVVRGLLRISDSVDEKFKDVPKTVSGVIQTIKNDLLFAVGGAGNAPLIEALEDLRKLVSDPKIVNGLQALASGVVRVAAAAIEAAAALGEVVKFARWLGETFAASKFGPAADDLVRLSEAIADIEEEIRNTEGDFDLFGLKEGNLAKMRADLKALTSTYNDAQKAAEAAASAGAKADAAAAKAAQDAAAKADRDFKNAQARLDAKNNATNAVIQNATLLRDAAERAIAALERIYAAGKIKLKDYFDQKRKLEIDAINAEIDAARAEANSADKPDQQLKALTKIKLLERQRNDVVKQSALDRVEAERQSAREIEDIQARIAAAGGDNLKAKMLELDRERQELLKKFAQDPGAISLVNKLFDVESARARADQIAAEADRLISSLQAKEASVSQQISAGVISQAVGEQQLRAAREETIAQLLRQRDALIEVYNVAPTPETLAAIEEFNARIGAVAERNLTGMGRAIADLRAELASLQENFAGDTISTLTDGLSNFFTSILDGSKSAGEALKDFVVGFARSMLQIATKALSTYAVLSLLDAIYPGLGKATAASMGAAVKHAGGIVGRGGAIRNVNPALFGAAPRYHQGGVAGLAPNEVPAILENGEEVLSRKDPRNVMNGGGQSNNTGGGTRVINVFDENFVADQMGGAAGEKVIMNYIGKNPGRVRQLLGI